MVGWFYSIWKNVANNNCGGPDSDGYISIYLAGPPSLGINLVSIVTFHGNIYLCVCRRCVYIYILHYFKHRLGLRTITVSVILLHDSYWKLGRRCISLNFANHLAAFSTVDHAVLHYRVNMEWAFLMV